MGKTAEQPKSVEDIDSPRHREIFDAALVIGVKPGANFDELIPFLGGYGYISRVVGEEPGRMFFRSSKPFILLYVMDADAKRLREDYAKNGAGPLRDVTKIRDYHYSSCRPD